MSHSVAQMDPQTFSCPLCLDRLKDPVTTSCGHSYCKKCLQQLWDEQEKEMTFYSCPQCRRTFTPRPVLEKSTMLAALVETLEKIGLQAAPADHCYAGAGDVACDVCTGRKLKALKSCLVCRASYCDLHLQPYCDAAPLQRHKLVEPSQGFQKNICPRLPIVVAAAERIERQRELEETRKKIQQKIQHTEEDLKVLQKEVASRFSSLPALPSLEIRPLRYFEDVAAAVTKLRHEIHQVLMETQTNTPWTMSNVDVLLKESEPRSREDFLRYSRQITLDPNTVNKHLLLSEENRKATGMIDVQSYCDHPERFIYWQQVLSREGLTGQCYWEVEWRGVWVGVAVAYRNISRAGGSKESRYGYNDKSWLFYCSSGGYQFHHKKFFTDVSGPGCSRVGVYLDHSAGLLSFYSVSGTMKLLHRVQTSFNQPLHVGLLVYSRSSAELMDV